MSKDVFMVNEAGAEVIHRPVARIRTSYDEFLYHKVEAGRASMRAGVGRSNDEIEAEFAARRAGAVKT